MEHQRRERDETWWRDVELRRKGGALVAAEVWAAAMTLPDGGTIVRLTLRALTDQPSAQAALHLDARLLDAVGETVVATDLEGRVTFWNRASESLYQWRSEEALGQPIQALLAAAGTAARQATRIVARLRASQGWSGEVSVRRKDLSTFRAHVIANPVRDADRRRPAGLT